MKRELTVQKSNIIAIFGFLFVYFVLTFTVYLFNPENMSARDILDARLYYQMVTWVLLFGLPLIPWLFVASDNSAFYLQQGISRYKVIVIKFIISFLVFIISGIALYYIYTNLEDMLIEAGLLEVVLTGYLPPEPEFSNYSLIIVIELVTFKLSFSFFMGLDLLKRYSVLIKIVMGVTLLALYVIIISSLQFYLSNELELLYSMLSVVGVMIAGSVLFDILYIRRGEV